MPPTTETDLAMPAGATFAATGARPATFGTQPSRRHDLDALRAIAMLLGIALHGALAYVPLPDQGWAVHDRNQSEVYAVAIAAIHGFRMPLFFLVSGFFTAMLWQKRGLNALLKHRFERIFVPLVLGFFTIIPAVWMVGIGLAITTESLSPPTLWSAAQAGDATEVANFLANGAAPDLREPISGLTPLSMAAAYGKSAAMQSLLAGGADANARNQDGTTALHWAAFTGQPQAAKLLLEHTAKPAALSRLSETPADMTQIGGLRVHVMAEMTKAPISAEGRQLVATLLADPAAEIPDEAPRPSRMEVVYGGGLVWLLLTLLPVFHHLWFLWFLCWLVVAFAVLVPWFAKRKWQVATTWATSPLRYLFLIPLTMIPQAFMGRLYPNFGPDTSTGFVPMPAILLYYAIFFFFGAWYFTCKDDEGRLGRTWYLTLPFALGLVFPLGLDLGEGIWGWCDAWLDYGWHRPLSVLLQASYVWLMTCGLMGLFRRFFRGESKTMRYVSDSSYWLYVAHLPLVMLLQGILRDLSWPAWTKLTVVCVLSTGLLLISYQYGVRYTALGKLLNGPRKRPAKVFAAAAVEVS